MNKKRWLIEGVVFFVAALVALLFSMSDKYCFACFVYQDPVPPLLWSEAELNQPFREQNTEPNTNGLTRLLQEFPLHQAELQAIEHLNLRGVDSLDQLSESWREYACNDIESDWKEITSTLDVTTGIYQSYWHALEAPAFF